MLKKWTKPNFQIVFYPREYRYAIRVKYIHYCFRLACKWIKSDIADIRSHLLFYKVGSLKTHQAFYKISLLYRFMYMLWVFKCITLPLNTNRRGSLKSIYEYGHIKALVLLCSLLQQDFIVLNGTVMTEDDISAEYELNQNIHFAQNTLWKVIKWWILLRLALASRICNEA